MMNKGLGVSCGFVVYDTENAYHKSSKGKDACKVKDRFDLVIIPQYV